VLETEIEKDQRQNGKQADGDGDGRFWPSPICRLEWVPRLKDRVCHGKPNPVSLCWRIIDTRRSYIWLTVWYSGSIGLAPEKLQHQGGGQIPRVIDREYNLQDGGLRSLRIRLRPWEFERQNAETGFARSHFRNSRLEMRDLDRNRCVIGFQTRGDVYSNCEFWNIHSDRSNRRPLKDTALGWPVRNV